MHYSCRVLSPGSTTGPIHIVQATSEAPSTSTNVQQARESAALQLETQAQHVTTGADILLAQKSMLEDPELLARVEALISSGVSAYSAIAQACDEFANTLLEVDDPYLAQRAADIREVGQLWQNALAPVQEDACPQGSIVLCETLLVQNILTWAEIPVAGVICTQGSPLMHAALIAQNLGIPVVVMDKAAIRDMHEGQVVSIDGANGVVDTEAQAPASSPTEQGLLGHTNPITLPSGRTVEVRANIASLVEAGRTTAVGADGVGLFRTEMLLEQAGRLLSISEQEEIYRDVLRKSSGPVIFRTFDIGADKSLAFLDMPSEPNPALGTRGMRLYRTHPTLFQDQLTALYRASEVAPMSIMFPMVTTTEDWDFCRDQAKRVASTVLSSPANDVSLGVMIEVPSLGFLVPELALHGAHFASLGTNDLSQYFFATDRESDASYHSGLALLRFIHAIAASARDVQLPLGVCGGLAADVPWAILFAAMGIYSLSVPLPSVQPIKAALSRHKEYEKLVTQAIQGAHDYARIMDLLRQEGP